MFVETAQRAVIDDLPVSIAPRCIEDLSDGALRDVSGHHPIEQTRRIGPADAVFVQWRHVEQRRRVPDRRILALGMRVVRARHLIPRPAPPRLRTNERRGAYMKGRSFEQTRYQEGSGKRDAGSVTTQICFEDLWEGAPDQHQV